jgi:hypothetical protein
MPATTDGLARRFRDALEGPGASAPVVRLRLWLERMRRIRGARHVQ